MEFSHGIEEGEAPAPITDGISKEQGRAWGRKREVHPPSSPEAGGEEKGDRGVCVMGKERKKSRKSALSLEMVGAH